MKKLAKSLLCMVLSFLMILYLVPASVIAEVIDSLMDDNTSDNLIVDVSDDGEVDALFELTDLRTEDTKYIRMSDGTYRAVVYKIPVHEKNENGVFEEVDNSLADAGSDFESKGSRVKFSKKISGNARIFTLKNGNHKISLSLVGVEKKTAITVVNNGAATKKAATKWEELTILQNSVSSVRYNEILPGTDLEYLLLGSMLKENILINKKQDSYVYTFELSLNNLTAELTDEGSILLSTEKEEILYQMPAPYMYDAAGEYSDEVSYSLTKSGNGKYLLTITADSEWINAEKRAFPVTIDPTIDVTDSTDISDTYQHSKNPDTNYGGGSNLYVGNKDGYTQYILISINNLPTLPAGSMVTEAELRLQITGHNLTNNAKRTILMQKVNAPQALSGITWNTQVEYTEEAYDYEEVDANTTYCYFNLAKMYHEWGEDGGKILRLSMVGSSSQHTNYVMFASSNNTSSDVMTPYFELTYVNTLGIEDYYSYRTQSAGDAGTVYIGDHTGQLTLSRTDAVSDNTALSASVGHVYNSALASGDYSVKDASGNDLFASMKAGAGFMLSAQQTLRLHTSGETYCEYLDGDGTIHYMKCSKTTSLGYPIEYVDTDGLGLTVVDPTESNFANKYSLFADFGFEYSKSLLLMDQKGSCWLFYNGLPAMFADSNGNLIKYLYNTTSSSGTAWFPVAGSGNALRAIVQNNKISDTAYSSNITLATFTYSGGYLNTVVTSGRTLYFVYQTYNSQKLLTKVTVSETVNTSNSYSYTLAEYGYTNGMLTTVYDTERQYGIRYTYDSGTQKYTEFYEFAGTMTSHTVGGKYSVAYKAGQTEFTCCGASNTSDDDIIYVSVFDNYGRTVNSYIKDANGAIYSATAGAYTDSGDFSKNHIADTSSIGMTGANLLANPSMETNTAFSNFWYRSDDTNIACSTGVVRNGTSSVKMQFNDISDFSMYLYQNVSTPTSGQYCFSVYVNMSKMQAVNPTSNGGVVLQIYKSGALVKESTMYNGNYAGGEYTPTDPNKEWHRLHVAFTAEEGAEYQVRILGKDMYGKLYVDDAQLEKGSVPGAYNLLSLQFDNTSAFGWAFDLNSVAYGSSVDAQLQMPLVFSNFSDMPKNITVTQTITNVKGKGFTLSGWTESYAAPNKAEAEEERFLGLRATVIYENTELPNEVFYVPFNPYISELQYACGTVIPSHREKCSIIIEIVYKNNVNSAKFYAISLAESDAIGYTYDSKGNIRAATKAGLEKSVYEYDDISNNLTSFANGTICTGITYDEEQNGYLPSTVTTQGITSEFTYDRAGNVTGTVLRPEGTVSAATIHTASTFDTRLARLTASTDERGNVTSYTYNADGSVKSVTLDNVETEYLYGQKGRQSRIMIDSLASVMYAYNKGNLSGITVGGIQSSGSLMSYSMTYDSFGRTLSVKVGNETLATYTYEEITGYLLTMTYGNGSTLRYDYDKLGRTQFVYQDEMCRFEYEYDGSGNLYKLTDSFTGTVYLYGYDSVGNLTSEEQYNLSNNAFMQGQYYTYNSYGDLACSTLQIAGMDPVRYVCSYDYESITGKTSLVDEWKAIGTGYKVDYTYDGLDRISRQWYRANSDISVSPVLTKNYSYLSNTDGTATTLVSGIQYGGYTSRGYSYTYDNLGNITEVYNGSTLEASYTYDDLGQLTRENSKLANKTYVYTYDDRGNVVSRKTYAYTTGTLGTVQSTDSYGYYQQYDTEMWGDVLKSYNGTTFSYDSIGNPLTYYNGASYTFTWSNGRQLVSGTKGSTSFRYSYNSDGLRTKKIVGNQTYTYYWNGTQLAAMTITTGSNVSTLKFYYDAEGVPFYFDYNGTQYFYITNLQGDVVGIANENGFLGYYEYDAWGRILSINSASSNEYGALTSNPLRYRGYICDNETGFYYLQSRYYDPAIRRFINADSYASTGNGFIGYNMFAYCNNNPIMYIDPNGELSILGALVILAATEIINYVVNDVILPELGIDGDVGEVYEEKMYSNYNGPGVEENGDITVVDFEAYGYKKTLLTEYGDLSNPTFLLAKVNAQYDYTGIPSIEASYIMSLYTVSCSKTFKFFGITLEVSATIHIGAIGAGAKMDFKTGEFEIIPPMFGVVPDFSFDFD